VFKEVARKFIPAAIVDRIDKRGFSAPVNKWFEWDKKGKYDRSSYKRIALEDWKAVFLNDHFSYDPNSNQDFNDETASLSKDIIPEVSEKSVHPQWNR
jgi:hypothetical protein